MSSTRPWTFCQWYNQGLVRKIHSFNNKKNFWLKHFCDNYWGLITYTIVWTYLLYVRNMKSYRIFLWLKISNKLRLIIKTYFVQPWSVNHEPFAKLVWRISNLHRFFENLKTRRFLNSVKLKSSFEYSFILSNCILIFLEKLKKVKEN